MNIRLLLVASCLLFGICGGQAALAQKKDKPTVKTTTKHSAAWYRTHRKHSAAWYKTHRKHSAAWYRTHRKHSAAWYKTHSKKKPAKT